MDIGKYKICKYWNYQSIELLSNDPTESGFLGIGTGMELPTYSTLEAKLIKFFSVVPLTLLPVKEEK